MLDVQIFSSDTCQTMGDVMREIDAASLVRGYFILLGINSITNMNFVALLEQHKYFLFNTNIQFFKLIFRYKMQMLVEIYN